VKHLFLHTVDRVAQAVLSQRKELGLTQAQVAAKAGVSRQFVIELEHGRPRGGLGKVLAVLAAVEIHAYALPSLPNELTSEDISLEEVLARFA
jgi:HTH-type transcriptional regulator/antitoxin HipB